MNNNNDIHQKAVLFTMFNAVIFYKLTIKIKNKKLFKFKYKNKKKKITI